MVARPLLPSEVLAQASAPYASAANSALGVRRYLVVAAGPTDQQALTCEELEQAALWLRQQVCPILAIAPAQQASSLTDACDVVLSHVDELPALLANIEHAPRAATVLVQVLRAAEGLSLEQALLLESLAYATLQAGPEFQRWLAGHVAGHVVNARQPPVLVERVDEVLSVTLNQPERRNAMSVAVRDALCEALQLVLSDTTITQVRLSGSGECFSTGGDLDEFGTTPDPVTGHLVRSLQLPARLLAHCAERVECRVHSACIGAGIELPAFAKRLVATPDAFFQLPELKFGLIPGAGGCVSIPRRIGRQRTAWLALSGRRINSRTALEWGLVDALI